MNIVSGKATPTTPNTTPPSVVRTLPGSFTSSNSRDTSWTMTTSTVTTRAANRPNGIPASSCQSSKVYCGTW